MTYVGKKRDCGCWVGCVVDEGDGRSVAELILRGLIVERHTMEEVRDHGLRHCAHEQQIELFSLFPSPDLSSSPSPDRRSSSSLLLSHTPKKQSRARARAKANGATSPPEALGEEDRIAIAVCLEVPTAFVVSCEAACLDWARSNGRRKSDWIATVRNWCRNELASGRGRAYQSAVKSPLEATRTYCPGRDWALCKGYAAEGHTYCSEHCAVRKGASW